MINVNDLVYCRNSSLQVLTINSHTHTHTTLSLFVWFFLTSLFVSCSMDFSHIKKVWKVFTFQKYFLFFLSKLFLYS